jgi:UDP-GlcNAc:undecaprenyl-phosphate GlcNAc-1-phosphate transferase
MTLLNLPPGTVLLATLVISLLFTQLMIHLARRYEWIEKPKADRWHQKPTALYGGVGIFATFATGCAMLQYRIDYLQRYDLLGLLAGGIFLFFVGLRDDARALNPVVKLMGQIMAVMPFLVGAGLAFTSKTFVIGIPLVLFWMVALTNAFNLLDNMDGLTAGTAAIVGSFLALYCYLHDQTNVGLLSALVSTSCLGFLWFNFRRKGSARIFMGDCGSMLLGYMLAGLAVIAFCPTSDEAPSNKVAQCILPLMIMAAPIFDTMLVIVRRKREGRAISQGGKDHSSHRLVYAGCSEKQAVFALYSVSLLGGASALFLDYLHNTFLTIFVVLACAVALLLFGVYLSRFTEPRYAPAPTPVLDPNLT